MFILLHFIKAKSIWKDCRLLETLKQLIPLN